MDQNNASAPNRATLPIVLGVLAVATAIPAWLWPVLRGNQPVTAAAESPDQAVLGKPGADPAAVISLQVASWDDTLAAARLFSVAREGDRWVIPSHHGYPADGNTRVTRTATGILGAPRGRLVSQLPDEHVGLGVVDPIEHDAAIKTGFGRRVTLKDAGGATVLDVIVGNRAEGSSNLFYVREAGKAEVYTAKVDSDLSTKFTDYVELDPFKIQRDNVRGLAVVEYQLDPDKGTIKPGPLTRLARTGTDGDWRSEQAPADKRAAKAKCDEILSQLSSLRLQGVRPFDLRRLQGGGFYLANQPEAFQVPNALVVQVQGKPFALFGTEGRLDVTSNDGLRYSLMFGKVALGDDQDEAEAKPDAKKDGAKKDEAGSNRYLAVFVTYDAALDEVAKAEAEAEKNKKDDAKKDEPKKRKLTGKERAAKAQERFQRFFYVISDADFKKLRPELSSLWEDKPKEPMAGSSGKTVKQWLADNAKLPGITTTASGLQYQILANGPEGGPKPTPADQVKVAYKGTLVDGAEFDANADMQFGVTGVIKGWTEALQLMKPGDSFKLFVPPELGYGEAGSPPKIGPNQILVFEVTLKEVVGKGAAPVAPPKAEDKKADAPAPKAEEKKPEPAKNPPTK